MELLVQPASVADCPALAETSKRAFDDDVKYGAPGPGGPPGYDSPAWHRQALRWGRVFRLVLAGRVVGGAIVIANGRDRMQLGRIWLEPEAQHQGWGAVAMRIIEGRFAGIRRWTLETPGWNARTQRFYTSLGYQEVGRVGDEVRYEKPIGTGSG